MKLRSTADNDIIEISSDPMIYNVLLWTHTVKSIIGLVPDEKNFFRNHVESLPIDISEFGKQHKLTIFPVKKTLHLKVGIDMLATRHLSTGLLRNVQETVTKE